jgi:acetoin utilization deacetylase AcuC-like enzyme
MTLLYYHDDYLRHDTGRHPETAARVRAIVDHLQQASSWSRCRRPDVPLADIDLVAMVHDRDYIRRIEAEAHRGGARVEVDTVVSRHSFTAALRAVGAVCDATRRVAAGEDASALCLVRPPGHHALRAAPMGFCLFNNVAIAAQLAIEQLGAQRVLIVDWDVHHGNGTQDMFWTSSRVGFYSVHRWPFYPGTGAADETGAGEGLGMTCNVPIEFGTSRADCLNRVEQSLTAFAEHVRPELIFISAGFDSHRLDPIGSLGLEAEDFATLTHLVRRLAAAHCQGRIVSALEGGYNLEQLPRCVAEHLQALLPPLET